MSTSRMISYCVPSIVLGLNTTEPVADVNGFCSLPHIFLGVKEQVNSTAGGLLGQRIELLDVVVAKRVDEVFCVVFPPLD